ncbi:CAP domain-containing protein [Streptomyces microflavus]|uniref:CAP domain-containing protein n=1 Tax=Streptomyces TaxID=1883 RepID=UPI000D120DCC|nr:MULTISPECIES: CAP domain-containing protein [Streptomyces]MCX4657238.1 CAP domain-containing protein [Streptomyces microflavus]MDX2982242.1 CAP domain-containing protein [Streptomyces sp. NRRL_B-2249]WSS32094.1 CAP domain-containing protein [Streptomyces microflavus]
MNPLMSRRCALAAMAAGVASAALPTAAQSAGPRTRTDDGHAVEVVEGVLSDAGHWQLLQSINAVRQMVLDGKISPRGKDIKQVKRDSALAVEALKVVKTHKMQHVIASDPRWGWIGQNLYLARTSVAGPQEKRTVEDAVTSWAAERKNFIYPAQSVDGKAVGNYTQLVWAQSEWVGGAYSYFRDLGSPSLPYTHLLAVNFGPGGNSVGQAPYTRA